MFATALALLVLAAPVPKESATVRMERLFGTPVDLDKDCKFRLDGGKLRIDVPDATHHLLQSPPDILRTNAPRTARHAAGDFAVAVRVSFAPPDVVNPRDEQEFMAGLVGRSSDDRLAAVWLTWQPGRIGRLPPLGVNGAFRSANSAGGMAAFPPYKDPSRMAPTAPVWLRLTRAGRRVSFASSLDGQMWSEGVPFETDLPYRIEVGVFAGQTLGEGFTATFENFKIDPLPAEGNK